MKLAELNESKNSPKVELKQTTAGSWTHIDIFVDGEKKFHAAKQGTSFWVIADAGGNHDRIGYAGSRAEMTKVVKQHLTK